jgi:membrane associated rhomboid family serine protease
MESQTTEVRSLVERGDALLAENQPREAAAAYARAVQIEPNAVDGHLGLAKANLALGAYGVAIMACRQVLTLAPESAQAALAQAILYVVERRFDVAWQELERVATLDPANAYAHALRGYCLRQMGRSYDAQQAEGKARRLSSGKNFAPLFPRLDPVLPVPAAPPYANGNGAVGETTGANGHTSQASAGAPPRNWDEASAAQRQAVRVRFATRGYPIVTYTLIAVNLLVYILAALAVGDLLNPINLGTNNIPFTIQQLGPFYYYGVEVPALMQHDPTQWYRVLTAMFLHANYLHIGLNMLSLYFVGVVTEALFGRWRFLLIYFASGLLAGLADYFATVGNAQAGYSLGASGAIFGIFGAFGAFVILRRQMLGRAATPIISQWLFWLVINLVFSVVDPQIALYDHIGGLVSGFILGALLIPRIFKVRRT